MKQGEIRKILRDNNVRIGFELECILPAFFRDKRYKSIEKGYGYGSEYLFVVAQDYFKINQLPFKAIFTKEYYHNNKNKWLVKPDNSIGAAGLELASPVMGLEEYLDICPTIFSHMKKVKAVTDNKCGFHLNLSLKDKGWYNRLDVMKLGLFINEREIYGLFPMRKNNTYCGSVHKDIKKVLKKKIGEYIIENYKLKPEFTESHHMAINTLHLKQRNKYIEFRYIGGKDYHKKWKDIRYLTAMFINAIRYACDKDTDFDCILRVSQLRRG